MSSSEDDEYRYLTVRELGKGGMGTVWEMHDTALNRRIAFKQMHAGLIGVKAMEDRFANEARILARLEHPGIVPVHELDVSSENGALYYTMEKVRGESLQAVLDGLRRMNKATLRRWTLVRLAGAFSRLCETVAFAHKKGILHRDIKPDNVMLGRFGEVFLVDWGLAKEIGSGPVVGEADRRRIQQTRLSDGATSLFSPEDNVYGTPGYLSPEAAKGEDNYTDGGSDIFALGAILYQMLTLKPPYQGDSPEEILAAAKTGEFTPIGEVEGARPHLNDGRAPDALVAIATMAMSPDRESRYPSAQAMRRDVEAFLQGRSTVAEESGAWKMTQLFIRRNPGTITVGAIAAISVVAIVLTGLKANIQNRIEAEKNLDLALERKNAFLEEKAASTAIRSEAAPRFAQLAWDRITLGDTRRARDLAAAALEFGGGREADRLSHLVLGLSRILQGYPELAKKHFQEADGAPFLDEVREKQTKGEKISWTDHFEKSELYALVLRQLEDDPEAQFRKLEEFLGRNWPTEQYSISRRNSGRSVFYRLSLEKGILPDDLDFIRGWPIHHLVLRDVPIADLGRLSDLTDLRILELGEGHLTRNLAPLSELKKLTSLSVALHRDVPGFGFDLSPLAELRRLQSVEFAGNVLSLEPLQDLPLTTLRTGRLVGNSSLLPLLGMPLRILEVENPTQFDGLTGMPLQVFRPGFTATGYSEQSVRTLTKLPLRELRFEGRFDEEFAILNKTRTLEKLETDHLHDLKVWANTSLQAIHLKGGDHDLKCLAETPISTLQLSEVAHPVLHPLLRASQLRDLLLPEVEHVHLETPLLTRNLIARDFEQAEAELDRLKNRYARHEALHRIAEEWMPVLENHVEKASKAIPSETWQPKVERGGHFYQWFKTPVTWLEAKEIAEELGGHLATIESEQEWEFLEKELGIPTEEDSAWTGGGNRIWIGAAKPGAARSIKAPVIRNRDGEAPSIYIADSHLVLLPTAPESVWSFIIEWDEKP